NLLDGLDGLAAGVCAISGITFCLIALSLGEPRPALLAAVVFGACLGFLRHNFYPARIFMGDSGALLLGFTLGALSVQGLLKTAAVATLLFPLLVLAVPIIDTSFVVAKRLKYKRPVYAADRSHLHHRFMNIGFSQPRAALTMWAWCGILAGAAREGVPGAGKHGALGPETRLQRVADGVEGRIVGARDDELGERRRGELVERDLRLPGRAFDHRGASPLLEIGRHRLRQSELTPYEGQEAAQVLR